MVEPPLTTYGALSGCVRSHQDFEVCLTGGKVVPRFVLSPAGAGTCRLRWVGCTRAAISGALKTSNERVCLKYIFHTAKPVAAVRPESALLREPSVSRLLRASPVQTEVHFALCFGQGDVSRGMF